ncbi:hypothetical protein E4U60_004922 [Claviceps pazoutovae]|uniref:Uncharacterized protein n=1 Tax=Claviceps pazoutovae TaxID=1649127 RepID=A0A9P7M8B9_9HYPO|nr:hypothetical protein E4U60_004922 [Claviceps pazoutovae]
MANQTLRAAYASVFPWALCTPSYVALRMFQHVDAQRTQAANRSSYFFKKDNFVKLMVHEFRDAINYDGPEAKALVAKSPFPQRYRDGYASYKSGVFTPRSEMGVLQMDRI